jgi:hypothetical protein
MEYLMLALASPGRAPSMSSVPTKPYQNTAKTFSVCSTEPHAPLTIAKLYMSIYENHSVYFWMVRGRRLKCQICTLLLAAAANAVVGAAAAAAGK